MIRIRADFNAMSEDGRRVWINTNVDDQLANSLHPGMRVLLFEPDDFEVEAIIEVSKDANSKDWWYGILDWSTRREITSQSNER
jgi:general stress protein 26